MTELYKAEFGKIEICKSELCKTELRKIGLRETEPCETKLARLSFVQTSSVRLRFVRPSFVRLRLATELCKDERQDGFYRSCDDTLDQCWWRQNRSTQVHPQHHFQLVLQSRTAPRIGVVELASPVQAIGR